MGGRANESRCGVGVVYRDDMAAEPASSSN